MSAVTYFPHSGSHLQATDLPHLPHLVSIERVLIFLLFICLVRPLLREQKDPQLEKKRINTLKLSAAIGGLVMVIHFYRILSGH
jgi:hypothetical protein